MKKIITLLLALAFFVPLTVHAGDIFIKKPATDSKSKVFTFPSKNTDAQTEKTPPAPSPATQPPTNIQDYANRYYKQCLLQKHPILKDKNLEMMCGCTAAKIPETMSVEQMNAMTTATAEGEYERNRMLLFVYAPCIEHPTRALVLDQCINSAQAKAMKHGATVCSCLADGMASFMKKHAPETIENAIKSNAKDIDPLRTLLESDGFNAESASTMQSCLALYEEGQAVQ